MTVGGQSDRDCKFLGKGCPHGPLLRMRLPPAAARRAATQTTAAVAATSAATRHERLLSEIIQPDLWLGHLDHRVLQGAAQRVAQFYFKFYGSPAPFSCSEMITAGFLSRAGAETPLNFREKFRVFPRTILENFSGVDTQTAVLVSTAEVWISAPDTQTPIFLGFLGIHS